MSASIFPLNLSNTGAVGAYEAEKPLYREVKWDFSARRPVYAGGNPVICEGAEAVLTWAFNALQTERGRFEALSPGYGCEAAALIGQPYSEALKNAEAVRYVRECLTVNPYIRGVKDARVRFGDGTLTVSFTLDTDYGEVSGYADL